METELLSANGGDSDEGRDRQQQQQKVRPVLRLRFRCCRHPLPGRGCGRERLQKCSQETKRQTENVKCERENEVFKGTHSKLPGREWPGIPVR